MQPAPGTSDMQRTPAAAITRTHARLAASHTRMVPSREAENTQGASVAMAVTNSVWPWSRCSSLPSVIDSTAMLVSMPSHRQPLHQPIAFTAALYLREQRHKIHKTSIEARAGALRPLCAHQNASCRRVPYHNLTPKRACSHFAAGTACGCSDGGGVKRHGALLLP